MWNLLHVPIFQKPHSWLTKIGVLTNRAFDTTVAQLVINKQVQIVITKKVQIVINTKVQIMLNKKVQIVENTKVYIVINDNVQIVINKKVQIRLHKKVQMVINKMNVHFHIGGEKRTVSQKQLFVFSCFNFILSLQWFGFTFILS